MNQSRDDSQPRAHILVVDDDEEFLGFMTMLLADEGYVVEIAATLDEWEAKLRGSPPDVMVCDLWLTGAPRLALLDRLDTIPDTDSIPIILCSGAPDDIDTARTRLAGRPVAVLAKPFDIDAVFTCLDRVLPERRP